MTNRTISSGCDGVGSRGIRPTGIVTITLVSPEISPGLVTLVGSCVLVMSVSCVSSPLESVDPDSGGVDVLETFTVPIRAGDCVE